MRAWENVVAVAAAVVVTGCFNPAIDQDAGTGGGAAAGGSAAGGGASAGGGSAAGGGASSGGGAAAGGGSATGGGAAAGGGASMGGGTAGGSSAGGSVAGGSAAGGGTAAGGGAAAGGGTTSNDCDGGCGPFRNCCNGLCTNPDNDVNNCGGCGIKCSGALPYCDGTCQAPPCTGIACPANEFCCGVQCCMTGTLCCKQEGPITAGPICQTPVNGTCDPGCAPLCQ